MKRRHTHGHKALQHQQDEQQLEWFNKALTRDNLGRVVYHVVHSGRQPARS